MIVTLAAVLACLAGPSLALPLDFLSAADPFATDVLDYAGPYSLDFYSRGLALDLGLSPWPLGRYGAAWSDGVDLLNPAAAAGFGYFYPGYPKSVDVARENFVRGDVYGGTEVGTRDEVSVRNGYRRSPPYPRFRRPFNYALRSAVLPGFSAADLYLRR